MARIFIGLPVYNGARFLQKAIDSLRLQSFEDWKLLISDNCSTDDTGGICKRYRSVDSRIYYYRHSENIGVVNNFKFLLDQADSEFFMWAAADDEWAPDFIEVCINKLDKRSRYGMAFTNIANIDSFGRVIREYPSLYLLSGGANLSTIYRYVKAPEILGKANLIYSVSRPEIYRAAWRASPLTTAWGSDMCFVLAAISQNGILIDRRVLFRKRFTRETDRPDIVSEVKIGNPQRHIFPLEESINYICGNCKAAKTYQHKLLIFLIMFSRLFIAIRNDGIMLIKSVGVRVMKLF